MNSFIVYSLFICRGLDIIYRGALSPVKQAEWHPCAHDFFSFLALCWIWLRWFSDRIAGTPVTATVLSSIFHFFHSQCCVKLASHLWRLHIRAAEPSRGRLEHAIALLQVHCLAKDYCGHCATSVDFEMQIAKLQSTHFRLSPQGSATRLNFTLHYCFTATYISAYWCKICQHFWHALPFLPYTFHRCFGNFLHFSQLFVGLASAFLMQCFCCGALLKPRCMTNPH